MKNLDVMTEIDPSLATRVMPRPLWDRLTIVLFVLAVSVPLAIIGITWSRTTLEFENRRTEPWPGLPAWSAQGIRTFNTAFERAFNDRFGGRDLMVRLNNNIQAVVFKKSPAAQVIIGKNDWLFVRGNWLAALQGHDPYPRNANEAIAEGIVARARFMHEAGIAYRLLYSPDKHTIYPEILPDRLRDVAKLTRIDDILASLPADIRSLVVDLRAPLLAGKAQGKVFLSTDSHWNSYGAWIGYAELARSLGIAALPYASRSGQFQSVRYAGDLARMMGSDVYFSEVDRSPDFSFNGKVDPCRQPVSATPNLSIQAYDCPDAPLKKVIIYRDSFGLALGPYVSTLGRETIMVSNGHKLETRWVQEQRPDLFVDQIVERGIPNLAIPSAVFRKEPELQSLNDVSHVFNCSITPIAIEEGTGHPAKLMRSEAKYVSSTDPASPSRLWYVLEKDGAAYAVEALRSEARMATIFGLVDMSTFNLLAGNGDLRDGGYQITLVGKFGDGFAKCATGMSVNVAK